MARWTKNGTDLQGHPYEREVEATHVADHRLPQYVVYNDAHETLLVDGIERPLWRKDPWSIHGYVKVRGRFYVVNIYASVGSAFVHDPAPSFQTRRA